MFMRWLMVAPRCVMLMRWPRKGRSHTRETVWLQGRGFGCHDISLSSREGGRARDWAQSHGQWVNQSYLCNETLIKPLDTEAQWSFLVGSLTNVPDWLCVLIPWGRDTEALCSGPSQALPYMSWENELSEGNYVGGCAPKPVESAGTRWLASGVNSPAPLWPGTRPS